MSAEVWLGVGFFLGWTAAYLLLDWANEWYRKLDEELQQIEREESP